MLVPAAYSAAVRDGYLFYFLLPALAGGAAGMLGFFATRQTRPYVSIRDVFLIVSLGWIGVGAAGSLPYALSGFMHPVDAFFEAMAGFTTTGASTVAVPEETAPSILFWRSLTQWFGGIGIVVLFVAVAPLVGFGATQLYTAEHTSPVPERLTPRIRDTAKVLAYIYLGLTAGGVVALSLAGMSLFDAVNHALTTVATGGFSTRSDSIAAFDSWAVELAIVAGMVLSGTNFALYFQVAQGRFGRAILNHEYRAYLGIMLAGTLIVTAALFAFDYRDSISQSFREALFQSASLLTGTAFTTADWNAWDPLSQGLLMLFMGIGGCAGSTSGGIKVVRAVFLVRNAAQDMLRMVHPQAVTPMKLGDRTVPERFRVAFLGFFFVYIATLVTGTLLMTLEGIELSAAFGSVYGSLNITGTALGPVGDAEFYAALSAPAKLLLTFFMLLGRLELFTVLVILTPVFWRN
jgi:trk system potassium uptake protein TrkH